MPTDLLFQIASTLALPGWAILILAPRGRWPWLDAIPALLLPVAFAALYAVLILTSLAQGSGGFGSLADLRLLFSRDDALLAGWVHYLAFDMMVGALLAGRMDRAGIGRLIQAPILVLTFLLGPLGALVALLTEAALGLRRPLPEPLA